MRLIIEIVAAALLVFCITATSAAFAAGSTTGRSADGPGLLVQCPGQRISRGALCRDSNAVRRKVLRQLLQRQDAVGDVSL